MPDLKSDTAKSDILLEGRSIVKTFRGGFGGRPYLALDHAELTLFRGETLGLMGPSATASTMCWRSRSALKGKALLPFRRKVQLISQRPESFFDPRMRLGDSILEPLSFYGVRRASSRERLLDLLEQVKLTDELLTRYPHQVSGGEIQRLSLCRALLLEPQILVLDEPTSMLDISVQAQILQILRELKETHGLSYLFITHDREVAEYMCGRLQYLL